MKLTEIAREIKETRESLARAKDEFKRFSDSANDKLQELESLMGMARAGIDTEKVERGLEVISVKGKADKSGQVITKAINDLAVGCPHMKSEFFGVKVYSGFGEQFCDCSYGYGPRHGSIVFSVGLTESAIKRIRDGASIDTDSAIYVLLNWNQIAAAKEVA